MPDMSLQDAFVLSVFSADSPIVDLVSSALCDSKDVERWRQFIGTLLGALQRLPLVDGPVYHWSSAAFDADICTVGKTLSWPGLLCAATQRGTALPDDESRTGVLFRILSKTGRSLAAFCTIGNRRDVLFSPHTRFRVAGCSPPGADIAVVDVAEE